jgi:hypothetical protein
MAIANPLKWRKSSYSGGGTTNDCVEVAVTPTFAKIRDTKDRAGGHITLTSESFEGLVDAVSATPKS